MPEQGRVKFNIERGATAAEFRNFLADLEGAYLALYLLPTPTGPSRFRRRLSVLIDPLPEILLSPHDPLAFERTGAEVYPADQLEITRISIRSAGWLEALASLNPLQQMREYLKDRHERQQDKDWRSATQKDKAILENEVLQAQAERERIGVIRDYNALLEEVGFSPEERKRMIWERLGPPLSLLGRHQDTGLLGSQNDNVDGERE